MYAIVNAYKLLEINKTFEPNEQHSQQCVTMCVLQGKSMNTGHKWYVRRNIVIDV